MSKIQCRITYGAARFCAIYALFLTAPAIADSFLGAIPVQHTAAGTELVLDMRRFYHSENGAELKVTSAEKAKAVFDAKAFELRVTPAAGTRGLIDLPLSAGEAAGVLTLALQPPSTHTFSYTPEKDVQSVHLVGTFNDWNRTATPMTKINGAYTAEVKIDPGTYHYKFLVDNEWIPDPGNPDKTPDGFGGFNSVLKIEGTRSGRRSSLFADSLEKDSLGIAIVPGGSRLVQVSAVADLPQGGSRSLASEISEERVTVNTADLPPGAWVRVIAADERGHATNTIRVPIGAPEQFRWQDGVMYYAFTDRFFNGSKENDNPIEHPELKWPANYHGGDFAGIRKKIESGYFEQLGVNTIWLAPINDNPDEAYKEYPEPHRWYSGYHGYWPVSPTETEPKFGTAEELKALIKSAHDRGMKVIADIVLNHVHIQHPFWKSHRDWFGTLELPDGRKNLRLWDEHQFTTWFEPYLPSFDFSNEEAVKALIDNAVWWAEEYNLDGYRLDAVKHIPQSFWWKFRAALRDQVESKRGRSLYLVGETFMDRAGIASFVGPNMLDGQFDFPLYDTIKDVFATESTDMHHLESSLSASERVYGVETLMSPLIGNHDKARFMAYADGDLPTQEDIREEEVGWRDPPEVDHSSSYQKLLLAQTFVMAINGVPMIYYGDEIGKTGAGDPDNRRDMRFGDELAEPEKQVLSNFEKLGTIRQQHPSLRYGSRRPLLVDKDHYAFIRAHLDDRVLAAFNRGEKEKEFELAVAPEFQDGDYTERLSDRALVVENGKIKFTLPGRTAAFITKKR